ncbi:hypothetical protein GC207_13720 [bacterium]|nr:hypothetical protein [bacterium]
MAWRFAFISLALLILVVGWLAVMLFSHTWTAYPGMVLCRSYGRISGTVFFSRSDAGEDVAPFSLRIRAASAAAWHWSVPTNFNYDEFELETGRTAEGAPGADHLSVRLPTLDYQANSATGVLNAVTLRQFLVGSHASPNARPTANDCEWIIKILERAHDGSFPRPRHAGIDARQFAGAGLQPPTAFAVSFYHFDLGMGIPWPFWVWLFVWGALVWFAERKWMRRRST